MAVTGSGRGALALLGVLLAGTMLVAACTSAGAGSSQVAPGAPGAAPNTLAFRQLGLSEESRALADDLLARPVPTPRPGPTIVPRPREPEAPTAPPASTAPAAPRASAAPAGSAEPPAPASSLPRPRATGWQADFILALAEPARSVYGAQWIPASVTIAQAIHESDWGRSDLAQDGRNYFGIKAFGRAGSAGYVWLPTAEFEDGQWVWTQAAFRAYRTVADSVADHHRFLLENSRYRAALQVGGDAEAFAWGLQRAGYASDPGYAAKLLALMDRYDLYRYDAR